MDMDTALRLRGRGLVDGHSKQNQKPRTKMLEDQGHHCEEVRAEDHLGQDDVEDPMLTQLSLIEIFKWPRSPCPLLQRRILQSLE